MWALSAGVMVGVPGLLVAAMGLEDGYRRGRWGGWVTGRAPEGATARQIAAQSGRAGVIDIAGVTSNTL